MIFFIKQVIRRRVTYDFQMFIIYNLLEEKLYYYIITLNDMFEKEINLKDEIDEPYGSTKPKKTMRLEAKQEDRHKGKELRY